MLQKGRNYNNVMLKMYVEETMFPLIQDLTVLCLKRVYQKKLSLVKCPKYRSKESERTLIYQTLKISESKVHSLYSS